MNKNRSSSRPEIKLKMSKLTPFKIHVFLFLRHFSDEQMTGWQRRRPRFCLKIRIKAYRVYIADLLSDIWTPNYRPHEITKLKSAAVGVKKCVAKIYVN